MATATATVLLLLLLLLWTAPKWVPVPLDAMDFEISAYAVPLPSSLSNES